MMHSNKTTMPVRYIVGSGWWSTDADFASVNPGRKELGDPLIRSVDFYDIWLDGLRACADPEKIIVVDSAAPNVPAADKRALVEWVSLPFNARHSTDHEGQWSGWMRSVLLSASYALASECDYFVYVEQDCLLRGEQLFDVTVQACHTGIAFGSGDGTPQPIQQSYFIIRYDRLGEFIHNLISLKSRDCELSPEWKFVCATSRRLTWAANAGLLNSKSRRKRAYRYAKNRHFDLVPFGSGRARPIPFEAPHYYFQHGTREEIDHHLSLGVAS